MRRTFLLTLSIVAGISMMSCQQQTNQPPTNENKMAAASPEAPKKTPAYDAEAVSNRIITQVAGVKENDVVFINGGVRDFELLEDLNTDTRKVGAFPLLTVSSDRMAKKYYEEVPEKYDTQSPDFDLKLATLPTVAISVDSNDSEGLLSDVSPTRLANTAKTGIPVSDLYQKRNVRQVEIGNDLYPTEWRAKRFGISLDDLTKTFWSAVNADYSGVQATGEKVKTTLSAGKELHITSPDGTDLTVKIDARPFFVSDGIISAEDVQKGGPAVSVFLPAGEVYTTPVPNSAEGKIVIAQDFFRGKEMTNVAIIIVGGKVTSLTGSGPGFDAMKKEYDATTDPGKDLFSYIDFGINPNLKIWPASKVGNWVQAGMVSLGTGVNTWAGGDNKSPFGLGGHLGGCTVTLDGKTIIEKGEWKS
ncbi:MAG TPA: aminopeptidase [Pyrinomonadaceae bacterium]|nr:aminopeptidase [Pyrinomonadaceae bacterium]